MNTLSIFQYLLCDDTSLRRYYENKEVVSADEVIRSLFLLDRRQDLRIPDHYYRLNADKSKTDISNKSMAQLLTKGLYRLATEYLELRNRKVYVRQNKQNDWQNLITKMPPMLLISAFLVTEQGLCYDDLESVRRFYDEYIEPNTRYTALVHTYNPQLEHLLNENGGFHDLHIHLNGSTETDVAWQDFLSDPDTVYHQIKLKFEKEKTVKELYEEVSPLIEPLKIYDMLNAARQLRGYFYQNYLAVINRECRNCKPDQTSCANKPESKKQNSFCSYSLSPNRRSFTAFLQDIHSKQAHSGNGIHPFYELKYEAKKCNTDYPNHNMSIEGLMYSLLFAMLRNTEDDHLASAFHYYLLILGLCNRMLVQQPDQNGFEEFNKFTKNDFRGFSEKHYLKRFYQLNGNDLDNISFIEGRFAPQWSMSKNIELIHRIRTDWDKAIRHKPKEAKIPQLRLVAHMIKRPEKIKMSKHVRFQQMRKELFDQAMILGYLKKNDEQIMRDFVGMDAASSEFSTPPEVFAPVFRMLRRKGFQHLTFHAGEDFYHLIGGLRAIYEAIHFFEYQAGDRIGHAVASGVSPEIWKNNLGGKLLMKQGEYLDDLVFASYLIRHHKIADLYTKLPEIESRINKLCFDVYHRHIPLTVLQETWLLRKYCPILIYNAAVAGAQKKSNKLSNEDVYLNVKQSATFDEREWCDIRKALGKDSMRSDDERLRTLCDYHHPYYRKLYDAIIEVDVEEIFSCADMELLQLALLEWMHRKEIVIETLPTSNVRIGHHASFETYHLQNWLRWQNEGHLIPPIVMGTDDTGIFVTNIHNEMSNVYCLLTNQTGYTHQQAMEVIRQMEHNAGIYKFG